MLVSLARLVRTSSCREDEEMSIRGPWCWGTGSCLSSCPQAMEDSCPIGKGSVKPQSSDAFCWVFPAHLEDLDLCGVRGADVKALQVWLKHPLHAEPVALVPSLSPLLAKATKTLVALLACPHSAPEPTEQLSHIESEPHPPFDGHGGHVLQHDILHLAAGTKRGHHQWGRARSPQLAL